jgi:hypothetical protein
MCTPSRVLSHARPFEHLRDGAVPRPRARSRRAGAALVSGFVVLLLSPFSARANGSAAGAELVRSMTAAHGGLERFRAAPTVSFTIEAGSPGKGESTSHVCVEQGRRRVLMEFPGTPMRMAWDGERAWSENWKLPYPPRFFALLDYYFLCLPWMAADPGVELGEPGIGRLPDDPTEYQTVRMTFQAGIGDTPDDYYVLYIHPETHELHACEYIVTYAGVLPEGIDSSPPHLLVYEECTGVDGLRLPSGYKVYDKASQAVLFTATVHDWSLREPFDPARLRMPTDGVVDTSSPRRAH